MTRPILEVEALSRVFVGGRGLAGVTFRVARGEKIALVGPNGAGKTTLLRLVAGILRPGAGRIRREAGCRVRFLPAREPFYDDLDLAANLSLLAGGVGTGDAAPGPLGATRAGHLSSGERRRALLAWGLAPDADLLLLDEPSAHLDVAARDDLSRRLAAHPAAILVATHDEELLPGARRLRIEGGGLA